MTAKEHSSFFGEGKDSEHGEPSAVGSGIRCRKCGREADSSGRFCDKCGSPLSETGTTSFVVTPPPAGASAGFGGPQQPWGPPGQMPFDVPMTSSVRMPSRRNPVLTLTILILVTMVPAAIILWGWSASKAASDRAAVIKHLTLFTACANIFYDENDGFWESGTTSFDAPFKIPQPPAGYTYTYLSDDETIDGVHEAYSFAFFAVPEKYSSDAEVMYVDEMGGLYTAKLTGKAQFASAQLLFASSIDWETEDLSTRCAGTGLKFSALRQPTAPST